MGNNLHSKYLFERSNALQELRLLLGKHMSKQRISFINYKSVSKRASLPMNYKKNAVALNQYAKEKARALKYLKITKGVSTAFIILGMVNVGSNIYDACTNGNPQECRKTSIVEPLSFILGVGFSRAISSMISNSRICLTLAFRGIVPGVVCAVGAATIGFVSGVAGAKTGEWAGEAIYEAIKDEPSKEEVRKEEVKKRR